MGIAGCRAAFLCGGLSLAAVAGTPGAAGAIGGEVAGDTHRPETSVRGRWVTSRGRSPSRSRISSLARRITDIAVSGSAANDFFGVLGPNCPSPDPNGYIDLPPDGELHRSKPSSFPDRWGHATATVDIADRPRTRGSTSPLPGSGTSATTRSTRRASWPLRGRWVSSVTLSGRT